MTFDEVLKQVRELLQSKGRVAYRALKRRFEIDDEYLEDLKAELIRAEGVAADEDGEVLVWKGATKGEAAKQSPSLDADSALPVPESPAGERRQLTVMFIDLVGSTTLSQQLDPEQYHERVRAYQVSCGELIARYEGHIAQYLGDGVLAYFGYPSAHEDDAERAVHSALAISASVNKLPYAPPLQVRIGIHTGPVVVAEIGAGGHAEQLALGETPNIAARVQGQAEPGTVIISAATERLIRGLFACRTKGAPPLKGVAVPLELYQVVEESGAQGRFEAASQAGLTPLIGREQELALLLDRWRMAREGEGQVVLLSGEPGIGKSRILSALRERLEAEGAQTLRFQCSPYHVNSAFYPIIDNFERVLKLGRDETPASKLDKLEALIVAQYGRLREDARLVAAMLSIPVGDRYGTLSLSPQKQKEETLRVLCDLTEAAARKQPSVLLFEDAHWADPTSLDVLDLLIDRARSAPLLVVLTHRPEFASRWSQHGHVTALTLAKLTRAQSSAIIAKLIRESRLPAELLEQILAKTDGVPLFVEEMTKNIVEAVSATGQSPPQFAIPATLQDALMARLDRLGAAKEIAQIGATIGREFIYELLAAVAAKATAELDRALDQLTGSGLAFRRGAPPQATYTFKHALIQDMAYASLLKSTRQRYHRRIAELFEQRLPELVETQPELVAHHYSEAGSAAKAIPYWQKAGLRAAQRSANVEAVGHLRRALKSIETLPESAERAQHELAAQAALGTALIRTRGWAAPETGAAYTRAAELCQQLGKTAQHFPVLYGVGAFHLVRADHHAARKLREEMLSIAQRERDPALLAAAHFALGATLVFLGEAAAARRHCEQSLAHYDAQQHGALAIAYGQDPAMSSLVFGAWALWLLGYPEQALRQSEASVTHARELNHPFSLAYALTQGAGVRQFRREESATQEQVESAIALATAQGFPFFLAQCAIYRGWALAANRGGATAIDQMRRGIAAMRSTGAGIGRSCFLGLLAEAHLGEGQIEEGLATAAEALAFVDQTSERYYEPELWRLRGELTLRQSKDGARAEAEECFQKALALAQKQQAKSLELRAASSLSRLWGDQGRRGEAGELLSGVYNWFTEGFDTKDLQEAKALLTELS